MKMKKFIKKVKSEKYDIPNVYDKIKPYAENKTYFKKQKVKYYPETKKTIWVLPLVSSIVALFFCIVIPAFIGINNMLNESSSPSLQPNDNYIYQYDVSELINNSTSNVKPRKKTITVNNLSISYPIDFSYETIINDTYFHQNQLFWINNYYLDSTTTIDIYDVNAEVILKQTSLEIETNQKITQNSIKVVNDHIIVYIETETNSIINHWFYIYTKDYQLQDQFKFQGDLVDFIINNNNIYVILEDAVTSEILYLYNNKEITNTLSKIKGVKNFNTNQLTTIYKIDLSSSEVETMYLASMSWKHIYASDHNLYLITQYYQTNDYQTVIYKISLDEFVFDGVVMEKGYLTLGNPIVEYQNMLYFTVQNFNEKQSLIYAYDLNNIMTNSLITKVNEKIIANLEIVQKTTLNCSVEGLELVLQQYDQKEKRIIINIENDNIEKETNELYYQSAYLVGDNYFLIDKGNNTKYDATTFRIINRLTEEQKSFDTCVYEYYFFNYLMNYYLQLDSFTLREIEGKVKLITDGTYDIVTTENSILLPVQVVKVIDDNLALAIDYWEFEIDSKTIVLKNIINSYEAIRLSNYNGYQYSNNLTSMNSYDIISCVVNIEKYYYVLTPNMLVTYIKNSNGELEMNYFIDK